MSVNKYNGCFIVLVFLLGLSTSVNAKDVFKSPDPEFIIESCKEVVEIYRARDEKKFIASQRTSLTEALRAGYCIGLITMTDCERGYYKNDWMKAAELIAALDPNLMGNKRAEPIAILNHGSCQ